MKDMCFNCLELFLFDLEMRFPAIGTDEDMNGGDTVDELTSLYRQLKKKEKSFAEYKSFRKAALTAASGKTIKKKKK